MSLFAMGQYGADDMFDAMLYGETHPNTVAFLASQVSQVADTLTEAGRAFIAKSAQVFNHYNGAEALRFARGVMSQVKGIFDTNRISTLWELAEMQDANLTMQRWIMANPNVRQMYHAQKCDGYSDTYLDVEPGWVKEDHYDYRRVMDGQFVFNPTEDVDWRSTSYLDQLKEGDRDLLHEEQVEILRGWDAMDLLMALGKDDPTSAVGGSL